MNDRPLAVALSTGYEVDIETDSPAELSEGFQHLFRAIVGEHLKGAQPMVQSWEGLTEEFWGRVVREVDHVVEEEILDTAYVLKLALLSACWETFIEGMERLRSRQSGDS